MRSAFCVLGLGLLILSTGTKAQKDSKPSTGLVSESVPFQLRSGFLIQVTGSIGSLGPLRFILDTGATQTVVDTKVADQLSLPRQQGTVFNINRNVKVGVATLPSLRLGPLFALNPRVIVGDLKQFTEFGDGVDAIIGLDVLEMSQSMMIDYAARLVSFKSRKPDFVAALATPRVLLLRVSIQGKPACLGIDTGLDRTLLYVDRLQRNLPQFKWSDRVDRFRAGWLGGETVMLSGMRVGSMELSMPALLIRGAPESLPADVDGYIGTAALNAKMVVLDFAKEKLRWR